MFNRYIDVCITRFPLGRQTCLSFFKRTENQTTMKEKLTIAIDCERNGLRGEFLSIAVVMNNGKEKVWAVLPESIKEINPWVKDNVLPHHPQITHSTEFQMLWGFAKFWKNVNELFEVTVLGHMIAPVETDLFSKIYDLGFIGEFEGPYRLFDINILLQIVTGKHDSLNAYLVSKGHEFKAHDPIEDAKATLLAFDLLKQDLV